MSPKGKCICLSLFILCLIVRSSWGQNCENQDGQKKRCIGYWYAHQINKCLKCPDGYYGENCSDVCPYPYFGELCRHKCNCSSAFCHTAGGCFPEDSGSTLCDGRRGVTCCSNYWYKKDSHECVECNPGYFGTNCMKVCPFPFYGIRCERSCNCSVDDCNYATGCLIPNIQSHDSRFLIEKNDEFSQKRFYLVVVAYVFGGVLMVLVLIFIWIELRHRNRRTDNEHEIPTENVPAYHDIMISEDGDLFISENEHISNEAKTAGL